MGFNLSEQEQINTLAQSVLNLQEELFKLKRSINESKPFILKNKDGLPIGSKICAETKDDGKIVLTIEDTGYRVTQVGNIDIVEGKKFNSLSSAAEAVSGIKRKSGWVFWKDPNTGKTLKEKYKG